jgi:integrase
LHEKCLRPLCSPFPDIQENLRNGPACFRPTFTTAVIQQDVRELDVQHLLGHASPDMVRRCALAYNSEQAARRHVMFSPGDRLASVVPETRKP